MKLLTISIIFLAQYVLSMYHQPSSNDTSHPNEGAAYVNDTPKSKNKIYPDLSAYFRIHSLGDLDVVKYQDIKEWSCPTLNDIFGKVTPAITKQFNDFIEEIKQQKPTTDMNPQTNDMLPHDLRTSISSEANPFMSLPVFNGNYPHDIEHLTSMPCSNSTRKSYEALPDTLPPIDIGIITTEKENALIKEINIELKCPVNRLQLQHLLARFLYYGRNPRHHLLHEVIKKNIDSDNIQIQFLKNLFTDINADNYRAGIEIKIKSHNDILRPFNQYSDATHRIIDNLMYVIGKRDEHLINGLIKKCL